jgi:general secretion pathway protein H
LRFADANPADVPTAFKSFRRRGSAFTRLEVMMVLALLGLLAGLFISAARNFNDDRAKTAEDIFWETVRAARKQALLSGRDVRVSYAASAKDEPPALVLNAEGGEERHPFIGMGEVKIDFLSSEKSRATILLGGEMVETQTKPSVTFYGDGTCSPFRVQIRGATGSARSLAIDPWTCAEVLPAAEPGR